MIIIFQQQLSLSVKQGLSLIFTWSYSRKWWENAKKWNLEIATWWRLFHM